MNLRDVPRVCLVGLLSVAAACNAPSAPPTTPPLAAATKDSPVDPWPGIELPVADHGLEMNDSPVVVVDGTRVRIGTEVLGDVAPILAARRMQRIDGLFTTLKATRDAWRAAHPGEPHLGEINLVFDASTPAIVVKSVFQTAAFAGFPNASFVVRRSTPGADGSSIGRLPADAQVPGPPVATPDGGKPTRGLRSGAATVNGRLPPEVIQRIVRQHFGQLRACYESGLSRNAQLQGRVSVKFEIGRDGHVTHAAAVDPPGASPRIPDPAVVSCVVLGFQKLAFPEPEGGIVTVVYPIVFNPGD